jgi:ADP-ribosylglycohydrolase
MALTTLELQDRFRAAILGYAVGDALGFPHRGLPPEAMGRNPHLSDDFAPKPRGRFAKGQFSAETQVMLAVVESIAKNKVLDGRALAAHLAWLWQEGVILQPAKSTNTAVEALLKGAPWMSSGAELGVQDASCLSRGLPLGLWSDSSPARLAHDATVVTVMTHRDPVCAGACAAYARALQLAVAEEPLNPVTFCEEVSTAASACDPALADELYYLPRILGWEPTRALAALRRIGVPAATLENEPGLPSHVVPVLLCAFFMTLSVPRDLRGALIRLLRLGGEVDVAAGICASLIAANSGTEAIPARLRKNVLYGDQLLDAADRLFDARAVRERVGAPVLAAMKR